MKNYFSKNAILFPKEINSCVRKILCSLLVSLKPKIIWFQLFAETVKKKQHD